MIMMLLYHFMAKFEVDINSIDSLTHKSDWHLISPYNITPNHMYGSQE